MAFGQVAGPPATSRQVRELLNLLEEAGHQDFRDARGPMGFTQRQAGGRFTRDEADAFIAQLRDCAPSGQVPSGSDGDPVGVAPSPFARLIRGAPSEQLAAELVRRGFTVSGPLGRG